MTTPDDQLVLEFSNAEQWESWLACNHRRVGEAWLAVARKGIGNKGLAIGDALDVALCFGWIDSHRKARDSVSFLQRYSPRRRGTPWSQLNVWRAEALLEAGRMHAPGLQEVQAARADGRWEAAYASQADAVVPSELEAALKAHPECKAAFERLSRSDRYAIILPVLKAVAPDARRRRASNALKVLGIHSD